MRIIYLLFFLVLALGSAADFTPQLLTGTWKNLLGSVCSLDAAEDGSIVGNYTSAVGAVTGPYPLHGVWLASKEQPNSALVALTVVRPDAEPGAITVWNGEYISLGNPPFMSLQWLMVSDTVVDEVWFNTQINSDVFFKGK